MFNIRKMQEHIIFEMVKKESDTGTAKAVVCGKDDCANKESDPDWVKSSMRRLEDRFDAETIKKIRMNCQCGYGMDEKLALVRELMESASSMEEFAGSEKAQAAGLFCKNGELFLQFLFCPCPMLAKVDKLETNTWCQCTTGYSKVLFEKAFDCEVNVELLKSIKMGDGVCLMKVVPQKPVWK